MSANSSSKSLSPKSSFDSSIFDAFLIDVASLIRFIKIKLDKIIPISIAKIKSKNTVRKKVVSNTTTSILLLLNNAKKWCHSPICQATTINIPAKQESGINLATGAINNIINNKTIA